VVTVTDNAATRVRENAPRREKMSVIRVNVIHEEITVPGNAELGASPH